MVERILKLWRGRGNIESSQVQQPLSCASMTHSSTKTRCSSTTKIKQPIESIISQRMVAVVSAMSKCRCDAVTYRQHQLLYECMSSSKRFMLVKHSNANTSYENIKEMQLNRQRRVNTRSSIHFGEQHVVRAQNKCTI